MTRIILILMVILAVAVPVYASNNKDKPNPKTVELSQQDIDNACDPKDNWKNHGEYVSCVAKLHPGGEAVSAAAKSDIGKKGQDNDNDDENESEEDEDDITPTVTPSITLTPTPTSTPAGILTPSPSATSTPTPTSTQSGQLNSQQLKSNILEIKALSEMLRKLLESLRELL